MVAAKLLGTAWTRPGQYGVSKDGATGTVVQQCAALLGGSRDAVARQRTAGHEWKQRRFQVGTQSNSIAMGVAVCSGAGATLDGL